MQTSESIADLASALAKAQGAMGGALKDSANPFFKSKYADLESVWTACRRALSENGLAVVQTCSTTDVGIAVTTMLVHATGQWVRDILALQPKDMSPQAMGSALTYARRYALAAIVGVYQSDDDAEGAHGRSNGRPQSVAEIVVEASGEDIDVQRAKEAAEKMRTALTVGLAEPIFEMHDKLNREQTFYIAVSALLTASERASWKKILATRSRPVTA